MSTVRDLITAALLAGSLSGCTPARLDALVEALETRHISSCVQWDGHAGPYVSVRGVTITGAATFADCRNLR